MARKADAMPAALAPAVLRQLAAELQKSSPRPARNFLLWAAYKALGETAKANVEAAYWLTRAYTALSGGCFTQLMTNFPDSWRTHELRAEAYQLQQPDTNAIEEYEAGHQEYHLLYFRRE
jgi:hypothetical protein